MDPLSVLRLSGTCSHFRNMFRTMSKPPVVLLVVQAFGDPRQPFPCRDYDTTLLNNMVNILREASFVFAAPVHDWRLKPNDTKQEPFAVVSERCTEADIYVAAALDEMYRRMYKAHNVASIIQMCRSQLRLRHRSIPCSLVSPLLRLTGEVVDYFGGVWLEGERPRQEETNRDLYLVPCYIFSRCISDDDRYVQRMVRVAGLLADQKQTVTCSLCFLSVKLLSFCC